MDGKGRGEAVTGRTPLLKWVCGESGANLKASNTRAVVLITASQHISEGLRQYETSVILLLIQSKYATERRS